MSIQPCACSGEELPAAIIADWQDLLELTRSLTGASKAFITCVSTEGITVICASSDHKDFNAGIAIEKTVNGFHSAVESALKTVFISDSSSVETPEAVHQDDNSFIGCPLMLPSGAFFGTLGISSENPAFFDNSSRKLLQRFRSIIEKDIADHTTSEDQPFSSPELRQLILESTQDGVFVIDKNGKVIDCNQKVSNDFRISRTGIIGKTLFDILPYKQAMDRMNFLDHAFSSGKPVNRDECIEIDFENRTWINITLTPISSGIADMPLAVGCYREITERIKLEHELLESTKKYRNLFDRSPYQVTVIDRQGMIIDCNPANVEFVNKKKEDIVGKFFTELSVIKDDEILKYTDLFIRIINGSETEELQVEILDDNKNTRIMQVLISPIMASNGEIQSIMVVSNDITKQEQIKAELSESREFLQTIFDSIQDGINVLDKDYTILQTNKTFEKWYEHSMPLAGKKCYSAYYNRKEPCEICPARRAVQTKKLHSDVVPFAANSGKNKGWVELYAYPLLDENGNVKAVVEYCRDITDRVQAQAALLESEERLALALRGADMALWDWRVTSNEVVFNQRWAEMLGYVYNEMDNSLAGLIKNIHPDDMAGLQNSWKKHIDGDAVIFRNEQRHRTQDGGWKWVQIRGKIVERDSRNKPVRVAGTAIDIDERKTAEEALRQSEENFRMLFNTASEGILIFNRGGQLLSANPNALRIAGCDMEGIRDKKLSELATMMEIDLNREAEDVARLIEGTARRGEIEWEITNLNGEKIFLFAELTMLKKEGTVQGYALFLEDVTELRKAEKDKESLREQLLHAQKMEAIGRLAGGIAHEFNNMMGIILGSAHIAAMDLPDNSETLDDIKRIITAAERSKQLTSSLLSFARKRRPTLMDFDVSDSINDAVKMLERTVANNITISCSFDESIGPIKMDPVQITHSIINVCNNACDAMEENGGEIKISTKLMSGAPSSCPNCGDVIRSSDYCEITVEDTGIGMSESVLERAFEPFFSTREVGQGTGLGLSTTLGIIQNHGGHICLESTPNKGTLCRILLPLTHEPPSISNNPNDKKNTILIADDEEMMLNFMESVLMKSGYRTITARSGMKAIKLASEHKDKIALVILDMVMPEMDGVSAGKEIKKLYPDIPVIVSSGYEPEENTLKELRDVEAFIQKPFSPDDLLRQVKSLLSNKA